MKKILMIAFHYPPCFGSSGLHRIYNFAKNLPEHGWNPLVLTVNNRAYPAISEALPSHNSTEIYVRRALVLDAARHLSIKGRYPSFLSIPDRWWTWILSGIPVGLAMIRHHKPKCIWVTFPIPSALVVGWALHKITRLPLIADFRDPLGQDTYPENRGLRRLYWMIEKLIVSNAQKCILTTPSALTLYKKRYPNIPKGRWGIIENGYDEETFKQALASIDSKNSGPDKDKIVLLHSGVLYPKDRNPLTLFKALAALKEELIIQKWNLQVVLRASGYEKQYRKSIKALGIEDIVFFKKAIEYEKAIKEMLMVDGLLLFQGTSCNSQIPAKAYEYIRTKKPILALTDKTGDTAMLLKENPFTVIADINSLEQIKKGVVQLLERISLESNHETRDIDVSNYSRKSRTIEFSKILKTLFDNEK